MFFNNLYRIIVTINITRQGGCIYEEEKDNRDFGLLNRDLCIISRGYDMDDLIQFALSIKSSSTHAARTMPGSDSSLSVR